MKEQAITLTMLPLQLACRKCGHELTWGQHVCQNCKTSTVNGLPIIIDFTFGLAFGIVFNVVKCAIFMVFTLGFLMALPKRWYYPIWRRCARIHLRVGTGPITNFQTTESVDFEVWASHWRRKHPEEITIDYIIQELHTYDCPILLELLNKYSQQINEPGSQKAFRQLVARLDARLKASMKEG